VPFQYTHQWSAYPLTRCDYLGWSSSLHPFVGCLYLHPKKHDKPPLDGESLRKNAHWTQLKDALQLAAHTSGSPVMWCNGGRENCTFQCKLRNHLYRGHPRGRRTMLLGKMIASAWTRVVEELKEGRNLREPVPPRHSPATSCVPSNSSSNGTSLGSREEGFWLPQSQKSHQGGPLQMFPANTTHSQKGKRDSSISVKCWMHASDLLWAKIMSYPNLAPTSRRLK
jgi:hypothetical protein